MKKRRTSFGIGDAIPFIAFAVVLIFFSITSKGRLLSPYSINKLIEQSMINILLGCGICFVVAQGSVDLSVGVNMALSGVIAVYVSFTMGLPYLMYPFTIILSTLFGVMNGLVISKLKVPSLIHTLAMLIGVRGVVHYIQTFIHTQYLPVEMKILNAPNVKIPIFIAVVLIMAYIFEFTKAGRYSQAIGENESVAKFVGVSIPKMKVLAYALSGLMAGFASMISMLTVGGTTQMIGQGTEMRTVLAVFLGGVLTSGGKSTRAYKVLVGVFSITIINNGLAITGYPEVTTSQLVSGLILLLILAVSTRFTLRSRNKRSAVTAIMDEAEHTSEETVEKD